MKITNFKENYKDCFPVGEGWRPLVTKLVEDIIALDKEVQISQIKEKYGGLRFYISYGSDKVFDLIDKAEAQSLLICEQCGTVNNVTTEGGWLLTLCSSCRDAYKKERGIK